ncbi:MAG: Vi polysaccharide biosynthesis UDP-N-acetylglucosamine C-6 dehydrogenase TviB [Pseudomonadota bacterium]
MITLEEVKIGVIGLGYVGLPLAVEFGKQYPTTGYDLKQARIDELRKGHDSTLEVEPELLASATHLSFADELEAVRDCNVYIVTVPTPVGQNHRPLLSPLRGSSQALATVLAPGDIVIYESTVYPGATEEFCVPFLESGSGLQVDKDFFVGYSPERINPGDKTHRLPNIKKVTAGSTPAAAELIDALYSSIIDAGTYLAASIKVAEAAKVIENTQRDVNIALINELAMIFDRVGIDTEAVLEAAGTKWNFLPFRPGMVGGHCIGVDPYYLTHKAVELGYHPEMILAGRRINDNMALYISSQIVKLMIGRDIQPNGAKVLVLGLTFKEDCPDVRNTKVVDLIGELRSYGCDIDVHDPWADAQEAQRECGVSLTTTLEKGRYEAVVIAVGHEQYRSMGAQQIRDLCAANGVVYDIKYLLPEGDSDERL